MREGRVYVTAWISHGVTQAFFFLLFYGSYSWSRATATSSTGVRQLSCLLLLCSPPAHVCFRAALNVYRGVANGASSCIWKEREKKPIALQAVFWRRSQTCLDFSFSSITDVSTCSCFLIALFTFFPTQYTWHTHTHIRGWVVGKVYSAFLCFPFLSFSFIAVQLLTNSA